MNGGWLGAGGAGAVFAPAAPISRCLPAPQLHHKRLRFVLTRNPLLPAAAMVALTAVVWVRLYVQRIGEMRRRGISPGQLATARQAASTLQDVSAADNFRNLFEVPVLFYVLCLALYVTHRQGALLLALCWLYVVLRAVHSAIHCTYNKVMHRFFVYVTSTVLLFGLWAWLAIQLAGEA